MKRMTAVIVLVCALLQCAVFAQPQNSEKYAGAFESTPAHSPSFGILARDYGLGSPAEQDAAFEFLYTKYRNSTNTLERVRSLTMISHKRSDRAASVLLQEIVSPTSPETEWAAIEVLGKQRVNEDQLRVLLGALEKMVETNKNETCYGREEGLFRAIARAGGPDAYPIVLEYFTSPTLSSRLAPRVMLRNCESAVLAATNSPLAIDHIMDRLAHADFTNTYPARYDLYPLTQTTSRQAREAGLPPETTAKVWDLYYRVANMPGAAPELKNVAFMGMAQLARATKHVQGLEYLAQSRPQWENGMFSDRIETILEHPDQ